MPDRPRPEPRLSLRGLRVLVMGLGLHGGGVGATRWLVSQGADVTVTDLRTAEQLRSSLAALAGLTVRFVLGCHREEDVLRADLVLRNPGVPRESPFLLLARARGIPVVMDIGLFFRLCPAPILAVTGTKGKSTTTSLLGAMIRRSRPDAVVAGNLAGTALSEESALTALELLPSIGPQTPVILELSSWQLEGLPEGMCPHVAAVTNVYPDHLNRYRDMADYANSKKAIFRNQRPSDVLILNYDNSITCAFASEAPGRVAWFSRLTPVEGAYLDGGDICWRWQGKSSAVCAVDDVPLPGLHNLENVLAATAAAMVWGAAPQDARQAIRDFRGIPHRLEPVARVDGVSYINDSAATAPEATLAALAAFPDDQPLVLIAGGSDKGLDYVELGRRLASQVRALILLEGAGTDRLLAAVRSHRGGAGSGGAVVAGPLQSLAAAVDRARELARPGDVVLLSPACASFGMFANEFERGNQFRALVSSLQQSA